MRAIRARCGLVGGGRGAERVAPYHPPLGRRERAFSFIQCLEVLYTWSFVAFVGIIFGIAVLLSLPNSTDAVAAPRHQGRGVWAVMLLFVLLIAANLVSTLLECGLSQCGDNPVSYEWLPTILNMFKGGGG